jgi:hypothetical protein
MAEENTIPASGPTPFHAKSLKLPTGEHKANKDHLPPSFGNLDSANIASPTALKGILPGIDSTLVKGNYTRHVTSDSKVLVEGDDTHEVVKDQGETIHGETKLVYLHGRDVTIGDEDKLAVNGVQEKFVLGESEETYIGKHEVSVPWEFEHKLTETGLTLGELKFLGGSAIVRGREAAYSIQDMECSVFAVEGHILHEKVEAHEGKAAALTDKVSVTADANLRVNALPDVGVGTPVR